MEKQKKGRRRRGSRLLRLFIVSSIVVAMIVTRGMGTFPPNPISFLLRDLVAEMLPPGMTASINTQLVSIEALPLPITDGVVDVFADKDALSKANSNSQAEMVSTSQAIAAATVAAQQTTTTNQIAQVNASNAATVSAQQTATAQTAVAQSTPNPATVSAQQTSAAQTAVAQGTPNPATLSAQQTSAAQTAMAQGTPNPATVSAQQTSAAQTAMAQGTPNPATLSAQQTSAAQTAIAQGTPNPATVSAQQTAAAQTAIAQRAVNAATVSAQQTSAAQTAIAQRTANAATVSAQQTSAAQTAIAQGTPNPATVSAQQTSAAQTAIARNSTSIAATAAAQTAIAQRTVNAATVSAQQTSAAQTAIARNSTATAAAQQTAAAITPGSNSGGGGEEEEGPSEGGKKTATAPVPTETATPQPTATATPQTTPTTPPTATNTPQPTVTNTPLPSTSLGQVGQPQHGQLIVGTNTLQYAPAPDFYGLDSFTYTVKGAVSARLSTRQTSPIELTVLEDSPPVDVPIPPNSTTTDIVITVNVNVSNVNDNPLAVADVFTLPENTPTNLNILANDTYLPDPIETLTLINLTSPAHGVVITSGTQLRYTPTLDYAGLDNFNYTISDGNGGTAMTTVTLTITNANNPPLFISAPILTATQGVSYSYVVQADDPDVPYGDSVVVSLVSQPSWLSLNGTTLTGLPTASDIATSTVTLMATDQAGLTTTQSFNLMVMNVNDAPTFVSTPLLTATQDLTYSYAISTNDLDLPYGDSVTLTVITAPNWLNLSNGVLSGVPTNNDIATSTVTLMVTDLAGLTATQAFSLAVNDVNDAPINGYPLTITGTEDIVLAFGNVISVTDIDAGNTPLTVTLTVTSGLLSLSSTTNLTLINGNNQANLVINGLLTDLNTALSGLTYSPTLDFNGLINLTMTTLDSGQPPMSDLDSFGLNITSANDAPMWTFPLTATVTKNTPYTFSNVINVSDLDAANGLIQITMSITSGTLSLANLTGLTFSQGDGLNDNQMSFKGVLADLNIALNGLIFTPTLNYVGDTYLQLAANDLGNSGLPGPMTATATITLSVMPLNTPPIVMVPGQQVITEDVALVLALTKSNVITVNDAEVGINPMSVSLSVMSGTLSLSQLSGLTFTVGDGITDTIMTFMGAITDLNTALNGLVFSPTLNVSGLTNLTIIANDLGQIGPPGPLSVTQTVVISITPMNDAPVVSTTVFTINEDVTVITQVVGYDPDGNPLTYQAVTFPTGVLSFPSSGMFTYTPPANWAGTDSFTYRANDGQLNSNSATISITVLSINDAPVFVSTPILSAYTNITYTYYITTSDIDGGPITLSAPTKPAWLTVVDNGNGTGVLTGTPPCGTALGSYPVTIQANDGISTTLQSFNVTLAPNNLIVDNTSDVNDGDITAGNLSLREAIAYSCPNDTITFAPALTGSTITLSMGQLDVTKNMGITSTVPLTISGNNASRVFNVSGGLSNVVLDGLNIFNGNAGGQSAGGLMNAGANTVTINNSTFFYNHGIGSGAIQSWSGTLIINNSTFYSNSTLGAFNGGALDVASSVTINNSTFVDNIALDSGGAIAVASGSLTIKNSTFSGNSSANGGHTLTIYGGAINLYNTIMANGSGGSGECSGTLSTNTNNLIEDGSCGAAFTGDPQLGPLQNNGGTTMSMALLPGSPAANVGDNTTCLTTDQRGTTRPIGAICDIGAYEVDLPPIAGHYNGLQLDGVNDYIQLPSSALLDFAGNSNLSIEMWINTTTAGRSLWGKNGTISGDAQYVFHVNGSGMLSLDMDRQGTGWFSVAGTTAVNTGAWTHVAVTKSGCNINFYVNGVAAGNGVMNGTQCTATSSTNQATFFISTYGTYFNGQADELRIWNVTRSQAQIQANMGRTLIGDEVGLVGYWRLEEGSGTTVNDTTTNALHGTLTNTGSPWILTTQTVGPAWRILNTVTLNNTLPSYEPEGQSVTYSIVANGSQGVATLTNASMGAFTYVPNPGAGGTDTFTYKVNDGTSDSNIATASIDMTSLVVSSLGDTDDGNFSLGQNTLREAITYAPAGSTITFDPVITGGTITLGSQLTINKNLTISGTVPITISGNNSTRVFQVTAGNVTFNSLTITGGNPNTSPTPTGFGGGIDAYAGTTLTLNNMTLMGNTAASEGGGLNSYGTSVTVNNSTLANNSASYGGGLLVYNSLTINNSTLYGNTAGSGGGAIAFNVGTVTINNSTIDNNSNTIYVANSTTLNLNNSILSNNSGTMCTILSGSVLGTVNNNLIQEASASSCGVTDGVSGNKVGVVYDPQLSALQNNGGTTMTMAPSVCSPVIDASNGSAVRPDQIGQASFGAAADMGAFEVQYAAGGSPITVANTNDSGPGSLREAICMVTAGGTINFAAGLSGQTITLASQLLLNKSMAITGNVPIIISGGGAVAHFKTTAGGINLNGLTLINGYSNSGASIWNAGATLTINNSTIQNNTGPGSTPGAIANAAGTLTINNSAILSNTIAGGNAGGVYNDPAATLYINNSTIAGNSSFDGGGVRSIGTAYIYNSTIVNNNASNAGGGINDAAGAAALNLHNTIVANNTGLDCVTTSGLATNINNLIETGTCSGAITSDPQLGPLQNNGGTTMTMIPGACGPAINAASGGLATDQIGQAVFGGTRDLGAFELQVSGGASSPTTVVQNTADSGGGSLREAITCIIASGGTITFNPALSGQTITLAGTEIPINSSMTIDATGVPVTVNANNASRAFNITGAYNVTMNNLTISNGNGGGGSGGGLFVAISAIVTLNGCTFSNNHTTIANAGGGAIRLSDNANVTVNQCTFVGNYVNTGGGGGAIVLNLPGATLTVNDSTFASNSSTVAGGAIQSGPSSCCATITIRRSLFNGNNAGSTGGGALSINNFTTIDVINSTLVNNTTTGQGGALSIGANSTVTLYNDTLATNSASGGGDHSFHGNGAYYAYNTLFAATGGDMCARVLFPTLGGSNNLVDGGDAECPTASQTGSPGLGVLGANGGPTQTMIPSGAAALGTGNAGICAAAPVSNQDQRGQPRGATCDMGAYETTPSSRPAPVELQQIYLPLLLKK